LFLYHTTPIIPEAGGTVKRGHKAVTKRRPLCDATGPSVGSGAARVKVLAALRDLLLGSFSHEHAPGLLWPAARWHRRVAVRVAV
jgi:hypothetical protein